MTCPCTQIENVENIQSAENFGGRTDFVTACSMLEGPKIYDSTAFKDHCGYLTKRLLIDGFSLIKIPKRPLRGRKSSSQPPSLLFPADKCWLSPKNRKDCGFPGIKAICTKDGRVLIAISKDLTLPPVNLTTLHLKDGDGAECSPTVASADTVLFQFAVTECGATPRLDGVNVLYETDVLGEFEILDGALGSVTRDSPFRLHVRCSYKGSQESDLQVKPRVYTLSPPLPATEAGILLLELRIAKDGGYRSWYVASDYPILSVLRDPVFVEVRVLNRNDPSLVLLLNDCWATHTAEPYSGLRWDLLVERCPFAGDNYKTRLLPVNADSHLRFPTHHNRFVVSTFAFWDRVSGRALSGEVYFHCSAEVCYPSTRENCTAPCSPKRRRSADNRSGALVTADGPILFLEGEERLAARIHQDEKDAAVDSPSRVPGLAVGVALLSVAVLVGTVAMWKMEQGRRVGSECSSMEL
ncbi:zona pellucida sperm-binding protein 4-like [Heptranchias perlo]|uniref:zona pellucida sperm-binding protein 4-like n=1 Tax=Heptranchias perlo TaxID=212740 RepID=UPI00355A6390